VRDGGSERWGEWETWRLGERREIRREGDEAREMGGENFRVVFIKFNYKRPILLGHKN
jgi:hypothetical protein